MFTGLIECVGTVRQLQHRGGGARLTVDCTLPLVEVALGDSIAVSGACLTVVERREGTYGFDVSPETVQRTACRNLRPGSLVNLERALRLGDRLGGHLVTGHVDCVATVVDHRAESANLRLGFRLPAAFCRQLVAKGSVTVDGVSLTVNEAGQDTFAVNVIPHTAAQSTLGRLHVGDEVNIETDILGKHVERLLTGGGAKDEGSGLAELLARNGFL